MSEMKVPSAWIELLGSDGAVLQRYKLHQSPFTIGRHVDCDLLLDDPHLAARHLELEFDAQGQWLAKALQSVNGVMQGAAKLGEGVVQTNGSELLLGKSRLRLRLAEAQLAPERVLPVPVKTVSSSRRWLLIELMVLLFVCIEMFGMYAATVGEYKIANFAGPVLMFLGIVVAWSFAWSLLSRLFSGDPQFREHLFIATAILLGSSLLNELIDWIGNGMGWPNVASVDSVMRYIVLAIGVYFHLRLVNPERMRTKAIALVSLCTVAAGLFLGMNFDRAKQSLSNSQTQSAIHPSKQLSPSISTDAALGSFGKLKTNLEQQRLEKPGEDDSPDFSED